MTSTSTMYVATVEVDVRRRLTLDEVDQVMDELEDYHPAVGEARRGFLSATIALPAESLRQATASACRVVEAALGGPAIAAEVMTEAEFDVRQGWAPVPDLVSVSEAAELLGVSRQAVLQRISAKTLPATPVGKTYVIPRSAVDAATETV